MERAPSMSSDRGRSRSRTGFPRLLPPLPGSIETSLEIKRQAVHGDLGAKFFDTVVEATGVEKIENKFCKQFEIQLAIRQAPSEPVIWKGDGILLVGFVNKKHFWVKVVSEDGDEEVVHLSAELSTIKWQFHEDQLLAFVNKEEHKYFVFTANSFDKSLILRMVASWTQQLPETPTTC